MLIRFTGDVRVTVAGDRAAACEKLDGYESRDSMLAHVPLLPEHGLEGGGIKLTYLRDADRFEAITEFRFPRALTKAQIADLTKTVVGQWTDGLGEGCFEEIGDEVGARITLDPLSKAYPIRVEQIKDAAKTKRRAAVYFAAREGKLDEVIELLDAGADIEESFETATPLCTAILAGQKAVALALIERGANVFAARKSNSGHAVGADCLMSTATSNRLRDADAAVIARELISRGVSPNGERDGYTPLFMARNREKTKLEAVLLELGATA